jgi:hypothetical protein
MALTYGHNLKEGDEMIASPVQVSEMMSRYFLPGSALVNNFPFRMSTFLTMIVLAPHSYFQ